MKSIIFLAVALLLWGNTQAQTEKKEYMVCAVSFYNFENLFDTVDNPYKFDEEFTPNGANAYTSEIYRAKLHNLSTVIKQIGTDFTPDGPALLGTAEVENNTVLQDLVGQPEIASRQYKYVWFEGPDARGIDVALLYNPKYFRVLNAKALKVDLTGDEVKGGSTRDVLFVQGLLLGDTTYVMVNHWPSRRGGEAASAPLRAIAAGVDKRMMDSVQQSHPNAKIIIMGDLNDDPTNESVTKVLGAVGNREQVPSQGLYNPFMSFYKAGKGTLAYQDSWNLFDQIMISEAYLKPNNGLQYWKAEVFRREYLIAKFGQYKGYPLRSFDGNRWINGYSDHLPTIIYLVKEK